VREPISRSKDSKRRIVPMATRPAIPSIHSMPTASRPNAFSIKGKMVIDFKGFLAPWTRSARNVWRQAKRFPSLSLTGELPIMPASPGELGWNVFILCIPAGKDRAAFI